MSVGKHEDRLPIECGNDPDFQPIFGSIDAIVSINQRLTLARRMIQYWNEKENPEAQMSWEDEYMFLEGTIRGWIRRLQRFIHFNPTSDSGIFCSQWVEKLEEFIQKERKELVSMTLIKLKV